MNITEEMIEEFAMHFWPVNYVSKLEANREGLRAALTAAISAGEAVRPVADEPMCKFCNDSGIEFVSAGHGNINEEPCSMCQPSTPVTGGVLQDVVAMSADPESKRVLRLHFNRDVTGDDRKRLCDLHNAAIHPSPASAGVVGAVPSFEAKYPEIYWHIAKGKICAGEPLYGAIIITLGGTEIGHGESDVSADDAFRIAVLDAGLNLPASPATDGGKP